MSTMDNARSKCPRSGRLRDHIYVGRREPVFPPPPTLIAVSPRSSLNLILTVANNRRTISVDLSSNLALRS